MLFFPLKICDGGMRQVFGSGVAWDGPIETSDGSSGAQIHGEAERLSGEARGRRGCSESAEMARACDGGMRQVFGSGVAWDGPIETSDGSPGAQIHGEADARLSGAARGRRGYRIWCCK